MLYLKSKKESETLEANRGLDPVILALAAESHSNQPQQVAQLPVTSSDFLSCDHAPMGRHPIPGVKG